METLCGAAYRIIHILRCKLSQCGFLVHVLHVLRQRVCILALLREKRCEKAMDVDTRRQNHAGDERVDDGIPALSSASDELDG